MLTFLRKIRKSIIQSGNDRNPSSPLGRYLVYALGEILLVMIGILLALQVNNWNEKRKMQVKENIYLTELKSDIEDSKIELDRVIDKTKKISENCDTLIKLLKFKSNATSLRRIDTLTGNVTGYTIFMGNEGVINDIIGSGQIDLINNNYLRTRIASWHADLSMIREWEKIGREASHHYNDLLDPYVDLTNLMQDQPALLPSYKNELVKDRSLRNAIFIIAGNSITLNEMYSEKSTVLDSMMQVIDEEINTNQ